MSTQFKPKNVLSKNEDQYDSLAYQLMILHGAPVQDDLVQAQTKAVEAALTRLDVEWALQKEP